MVSANSLRRKIFFRTKCTMLVAPHLVHLYLVGMLFSSFLPASAGGDVVSIVGLASVFAGRADSLASRAVMYVLLLGRPSKGCILFAIHGRGTAADPGAKGHAV